MNVEKLKAMTRQYLEENSRSISKLAVEIGVSKGTLSMWLRGQRELSKAATRKLVRTIDPVRGDLDAIAHKFSLSLRRACFDNAEIAQVGLRIHQMALSSKVPAGNGWERSGTD